MPLRCLQSQAGCNMKWLASCVLPPQANSAALQIEAHHYCAHPNEEMRQCIIYDRWALLCWIS